jgi:hypothetical protein
MSGVGIAHVGSVRQDGDVCGSAGPSARGSRPQCEADTVRPLGDGDLRVLESEVAQLREALSAQQVIGTAIGLVAGRYALRTDQAFGVLVRVSQHTNVKVRIIARVLVGAFNGELAPSDTHLLEVLAPHLPGMGWASEGAARPLRHG